MRTRRMMPWGGRWIGVGALFAFALAPLDVQTRPLTADAETRTPFLWKIEGARPTYLYGTIHVPDPRVVELPPSVEQAFAASQAVFTEIRMDPATQIGVQGKVILPDDQHLREIIGQPLFDRLSKAVDRSLPKDAPPGMGVMFGSMLDRMKPWAAMSTLELLEFLPDMLAGRQALDAMLYDRAQKDGKEVGALETVDEQLAVFEGFTNEEQARMLKLTLDSMDTARAKNRSPTDELIRGYLSGDLAKLSLMMTEAMRLDPVLFGKFSARALDDRNKLMVDRILAKRAERPDKTCFFAVGALHYAGETGIIGLLRKKGLTVTRVGAP
jgi:uncharacterized protein YbaP (TraB family)